MNPTDSNQPVALITGSGRQRVGNVIAKSLAQQGHRIALHYRSSEEEAKASVDEFRSSGYECEAFRADVSQEKEVDRMFDLLLERYGRLDALVTAASIWGGKPLEEVGAEDVMKNFQVNTLGTFLCARRAGLVMASQSEGGCIVTIGDWATSRPYPDYSAYFVSKGAIETLTQSLAVELARRNPKVRVNCVHPGPVMFPPDASEQERESMIDSTLVKSANCPESVAQAVRFFIENKFVTGAALPVDGGRTIYARESDSKGRPI